MRGRYIKRIWQHDPALYAPLRYRRACDYAAFIPEPLAGFELDLPGAVATVLSEAERAVLELNRTGGAEFAPLARLLLRTESIASSKVEGMQVDARTLARAEARQDTGQHIGTEAAEILANIDAMELAIERSTSDGGVRPDSLRDIHRALLSRDPNARTAGEFRTTQNWIGGNNYNPCGAEFVPPPPDEVPSLIDDLCRFCNEEDFPPLAQAAIVHAQFETIHPFEDGNGRTGRALVQVILRRRGVAPTFVPPISVMLARQRDRYIDGLALFREDRLAEWIELFAEATAGAAQLARRYSDQVLELQEKWRRRLRAHTNPRADAAAWSIIDILPAHPILSVPIAVAATGRTRPAVTNAFMELENAGVLGPLNLSRRNRMWEAEGLLEIMVGLEDARF